MTYNSYLGYLSPDVIWRGVKKNLGRIDHAKGADIKAVHVEKMAQLAGSLFVRVAGLSGATAVALGAYGTHALYPKKDVPDELKGIFRTANYYHFLHTLALLAVPLTRRPMLVGPILISGMAIFCGTCYFHALTGNSTARVITPYGGMLLIIGWLAMLI